MKRLLNIKKTISQNWADEVELSEQLQETLEEKESEENVWSLTTSNLSPSKQPIPTTSTTPHKDRRRRRKRYGIVVVKFCNSGKGFFDFSLKDILFIVSLQ